MPEACRDRHSRSPIIMGATIKAVILTAGPMNHSFTYEYRFLMLA